MALGNQVNESLQEASSNLRNALAYAARQERPIVCHNISKIIFELDNIGNFDSMMDQIDELVDKKTDI